MGRQYLKKCSAKTYPFECYSALQTVSKTDNGHVFFDFDSKHIWSLLMLLWEKSNYALANSPLFIPSLKEKCILTDSTSDHPKEISDSFNTLSNNKALYYQTTLKFFSRKFVLWFCTSQCQQISANRPGDIGTYTLFPDTVWLRSVVL